MANKNITLSDLKICSFNMHGFNNGLSMTRSLCLSHDIILIQEHWLLNCDLDKLNLIDLNFTSTALSSMNTKAAEGIISGRPFGGVAILWNKSLTKYINKIDSEDNSGKCLSMKLCLGTQVIILTCVYFPCNKPGNDYIIDASLIIAQIESIFLQFPTADYFVGGDFNFECNTGNTGFDLFKGLLSDYNLLCCDALNKSNIKHSYFHDTLNHQSWLDHMFVSRSLFGYCYSFEIIDCGSNLSDHLPISCKIKMQSCCNVSPVQESKLEFKQRWDKADLFSYYNFTGELLQSIHMPNPLLNCAPDCKCEWHCSIIDDYYNNIVDCLLKASNLCVPNIPVKCLKPYWSVELDKLKEASIDMHTLWRTCGCPRQGVINSARLTAKFDYKQAIKRAAVEFER